MKFLHECDRCGTVFATEEIDGPDFIIAELSQRSPDLGMCPNWCGGKVWRVKETRPLPRGLDTPPDERGSPL